MECPYLEAVKEKSICHASTRRMSPGYSDMTRYCTTKDHDRCPMLLSYTLRKGFIRRLNWAAAAACFILMTGLIGASGCANNQKARVSAEPTVEYFKLDSGKLKPGKVKANAYYEIEKDERIYVFISPKAKEEFEKSGKPGKSPVSGIGFGPNGETVIFESEFALQEYEKRHEDK
ncbi:MAG: hypothetical protein A2Y48_08895 [Nitrospirae bacterium RIFCSPLOW2_12_42_9]|nr:MAG: hypothetical protein A3D21_05310 [Nitrospirae bacterium RIFCSPHIGHO2_02_FULL_42_12]OGW57672.1 MAG: hypothetical protein A2Y48_08895 [Nitrospirae bacterium RIFCSPLOW2_12_42_9]